MKVIKKDFDISFYGQNILDDIKKELPASQPAAPVSPGLFSDEEIIISEILSTDTDNLTPLNALQIIARWKKALSGR